ncbi:ATP synthase subunit d, mitochondrial-like [Cydia amplana]|uniref:ATP synthase subunit d, mitochondrial-like n=1 Tax=Cydia amplana TaxID=1869771 RepID=UPI002FE6C536
MANRFTKPSINWVELEKLVPPEQKGNYLAFKAKSDAYFRRVQANPPEPPKIDWAEYQKLCPLPGLVDQMKSSYEAYKVPVPADSLTDAIDKQWEGLQPEIKAYVAERQKEIDLATKGINNINSLPKFDEMTMEMVYDMYPGIALDPVNRPTFWPHTPDEQPGYRTPEQRDFKHWDVFTPKK